MPFKVPKSLIAKVGIGDLGKAVSDHKAERAAWDAHMARVEADAKLPPIVRPQFSDFAREKDPVAAHRKALEVYEINSATRHQPYPAPEPHQLVAFVLANGGIFEVLNDDPTPEQILAEKKAVLIGQISAAEAAALAVPIGRRRMNNIREADIGAADADRVRAMPDDIRSDMAKRTKALAKARPAADTAHLKAQADARTREDSIVRQASQMMADVEDLTADNIDNWRMAPFK